VSSSPRAVFLGPEALPALATSMLVVCHDSCQLESAEKRIVEVPGRERSSRALMANPEVQSRLRESGLALLVWKSSVEVERIAAGMGLRLANSPTIIARRLENKALFSGAAQRAGLPVAPFASGRAGAELAARAAALRFPLVFQLAHGFSGAQTNRVDSRQVLERLNSQFAGHPCRISELIEGTPVTVTGVAQDDLVVMGAPCLQLTGIPLLTPHPMGSCGNDFTSPVPHRQGVVRTAQEVGEWVRREGHRGVFGIDFVVAPDGQCWCIEVNPRLVASVPLWSLTARDLGRASLLDLHLASFGIGEAEATSLDCDWSQLIIYCRQPVASSGERGSGRGTFDNRGDFLWLGRLGLGGPARDEAGVVVRRSPRPGGELARLLLRGPLLDDRGALLPHLARFATDVRATLEGPITH